MCVQATTSPTASTSHDVITDLTISAKDPSPIGKPPRRWHRIQKQLDLDGQIKAWLYVAQVDERGLRSDDRVVVDIRISDSTPKPSTGQQTWERRAGGIWLLMGRYTGAIKSAVTEVEILFGTDAVDPRPHWVLQPAALQLHCSPDVPVARLSVLHGRAEPRRAGEPLRARGNGSFRIVQISDTHMVAGVGTCKDALGADREYLPECDAGPLTVAFIARVLDAENPDLVILTGDQIHHDVYDSQSTLFKVVAPIIERSTPFAAVFGNHDDEGARALSRAAQMSILQSLPFSLCEPGPDHVDGTGNYNLHILGPAPSKRPCSTLYLLDSHGEITGANGEKDYAPIKQSQINWLKKASQAQRRVREEAGDLAGFYMALAFQRIPPLEFRQNLNIHRGRQGEPPETPSQHSGIYDALAEERISALLCGHDHVNDFCARLEPDSQRVNTSNDPWLCYAGGSGFGGYCSYGGKRFYRGARVLEINTSEDSLETWMRKEHTEDRVDELVLVKNGAIFEGS